MRYLKKNGLTLSQVGLGTGRFGTVVSEGLSFKMLDQFVRGGGTVIDTARNYYEWVENGRGISEKTIGKWLNARHSRDKIVICTKGGVRNEGKAFIANLSRQVLLQESAESMEALGTDHIDIYLLHRDETERPVEEIVDTLQSVREQTRAKAIGVCNWSVARVKAANEYAEGNGVPKLDIVQTYWSIAAFTEAMWNDPTTGHMDCALYEYLLSHNMLAMAFTSQAKGFFQKAFYEGKDNLPAKLLERVACAENEQRLADISAYCHSHNISPTAVVNAYITQNALPAIALVSCSSEEQLQDILDHCDETIEQSWLARFSL